ncbi:unnamed protein product [Cylindrotheca closterium]|uniref:RNA polymerase III subunit Rpc25 domain-containing protein n=1 Tax=Cylindrotheca closterium TaxID=2856 RepID=A0AAD2FBH9_9STRA|nr:unnamed protein product [Cylindrotheca closterium]
MFVVVTLVDTIRIPANNLKLPTMVALHNEIDLKYPNRVLMDTGLVISRYKDILKISNGLCVPGDGGCHHECLFQLIVFRPFVEEVCTGTIVKSTPEGIQVSLGFFQDIFIPAYWMLRPSEYDEKAGLWVWTPDYGEDAEDADGDGDNEEEKGDEKMSNDKVKEEASIDTTKPAVKQEDDTADTANTAKIKSEDDMMETESNQGNDDDEKEEESEEEGGRWEMDIGAEIRFKVKSIQFTQVTNTAKGMQATTTTTDHSINIPVSEQEDPSQVSRPQALRKRSTSMDLSECQDIPAAMQIVASICEDGLGLISWWTSGGDGEEDDEGDEEEEEEQEEEEANDEGE